MWRGGEDGQQRRRDTVIDNRRGGCVLVVAAVVRIWPRATAGGAGGSLLHGLWLGLPLLSIGVGGGLELVEVGACQPDLTRHFR